MGDLSSLAYRRGHLWRANRGRNLHDILSVSGHRSGGAHLSGASDPLGLLRDGRGDRGGQTAKNASLCVTAVAGAGSCARDIPRTDVPGKGCVCFTFGWTLIAKSDSSK